MCQTPTMKQQPTGSGAGPALRRLWKSMSPRRSVKKSDQQFATDCGEIERVFRYIDENGDGKISPTELQRSVKAVGIQRLTVAEAAAVVESSDSDGDGMLSLADFERLMGDDGLSAAEKTAELREAFLMYRDDKDESRCITARSLKRMLSRLGESKTIRDCEAIIRVYDLNGDGVLSFDEFAAMMR